MHRFRHRRALTVWAAVVGRLRELGAAALYLLMPLWMLGRALGPFRAPGRETEALYGELYAAAIVRRWWLLDAPFLTSDTGGVPTPWWPAAPFPALIQALLPADGALALGLVVLGAMWLAGYGPYRLYRVLLPEASPLGPLLAGLSVQVSPVVLRAVPDADLAALGVGALALGFAAPRWAWIAGLWSWPAAVLLGVAGVIRREPGWLIAAIPALAVLVPPSAAPGALRAQTAAEVSAVAYLGREGAVFPMPPAEAEAWPVSDQRRWGLPGADPGLGLLPGTIPPSPPTMPPMPSGEPPPPGVPGGAPPPATAAPAPPGPGPTADLDAPALTRPPPTRPWFGAILVPLQRLHAGPLALLGLFVALRGARRWAAAGLAALAAITLLFGWQPFPGEAEVDPGSVAQLRGLLSAVQLDALPGRPDGVSSLTWCGLVVVAGGVGLARLFSTAWWLAPVLLLGPALENPRLAAPITALPLSSGLAVLAGLESGPVLVLPSPEAPFLQGRLSRARVWWQVAEAGKSIDPTESGATARAATVAALSGALQLPVDVSAAEAVWTARDPDAFHRANLAGFSFLMLDLGAVPQAMHPQFEGWIAARVGQPLNLDGELRIYDLRRGPASEAGRDLPGFNLDLDGGPGEGTGSVPAAGDIGGFEPAAETVPVY